jgi:hypothetical protein
MPKRKHTTVSYAEVVRMLRYEPPTGLFRWRVDRYCGNPPRTVVRAGDVAGTINMVSGYRYLRIKGCVLKACRVAWLLKTGEWPPKGMQVDHRDGNKANDAWDNLRLATNAQNGRNRGRTRSNATGFKGVTVDKRRGTFRAQITANGKHLNLGDFPNAWRAYRAYCAAAREHHGEFRRTV